MTNTNIDGVQAENSRTNGGEPSNGSNTVFTNHGIIVYVISFGNIPVRDNNFSNISASLDFDGPADPVSGLVGGDNEWYGNTTTPVTWRVYDNRTDGLAALSDYLTSWAQNSNYEAETVFEFTNGSAEPYYPLSFQDQSVIETMFESVLGLSAGQIDNLTIDSLINNTALSATGQASADENADLQRAILENEGAGDSATYTFEPGDGTSIVYTTQINQYLYFDDPSKRRMG